MRIGRLAGYGKGFRSYLRDDYTRVRLTHDIPTMFTSRLGMESGILGRSWREHEDSQSGRICESECEELEFGESR